MLRLAQHRRHEHGGTISRPAHVGALAEEIREALARVKRGQVVDLGDFAQYADDDSED